MVVLNSSLFCTPPLSHCFRLFQFSTSLMPCPSCSSLVGSQPLLISFNTEIKKQKTNAVHQRLRSRTWVPSSLRVSGSAISTALNRSRKTYLEGTKERIIDTHHCTSIIKLESAASPRTRPLAIARTGTHLSTVIRSRKQRDQLPLCEKLVSVLDDLMRSTDQVHVVFLQESRNDIGSKCE